jgi:hypothetical protein
MTGVLNAMVGGLSVERVTITLSSVGANTVGMTSSIAVSMRGATVLYIDYNTVTPVLRLQLVPSLSQSFFSRIRVEDGAANTFQTFTSASATYSVIGGTTTQWTWAPATLWAAGDVGETKRLIFEF